MNVAETTFRGLEFGEWGFGVFVYFGPLTLNACPSPLGNLFANTMPNEFGGDDLLGGTSTWMRQ